MFPLSANAIRVRAAEVSRLASLVPPKLLKKERQLVFQLWPAYDFMGPFERTALFVEHYKRAYSSTYGFGCQVSADPASPDFRIVWEMRQSADDLCIPYRKYLSLLFHVFRRRDPKKLSQANLVFQRRQNAPGWRWKFAEQRGRYVYDGLLDVALQVPQYRIEYFHALPAQSDFRKMIVGSAKYTRFWREAIALVSIKANAVPRELFEAELPADEKVSIAESVESDMTLGVLKQAPIQKLADDEFMQACFGFQRTSPRCESCPQADGCRIATVLASKSLEVSMV